MLLKQLRQWIAGQRVLLLGFGREGRALYRRILQVGGYVALGIADQSAIADAPDGVRLHLGSSYQAAMADYDLVFKSPGIVLTQAPETLPCRVTSLTELFLSAYRQQCIGITGTKGKSTTASLLYHVLQSAGVPSVLGGNIGIPMADVYEQIQPQTVIVLEIGVHQLEFIHQSPHRAVLLNMFEEHLDHYGTFAHYAAVKENIYRFQQAGDCLICGVPDVPRLGETPAQVLRLAINDASADVTLMGDTVRYGAETMPLPQTMRLTGQHNRYNCAVVYALARQLGVAQTAIANAIATFQPLPHRLTEVGTFHGIRWVDDSISTACETCIQALTSLPDTDTVLIGGMDRGISYASLLAFLEQSPVSHIVLMAESGKRMLSEASAYAPQLRSRMCYAEDLPAAVAIARAMTAAGKICLLSPAAASYHAYRNFEARGDHFAALAQAPVPDVH